LDEGLRHLARQADRLPDKQAIACLSHHLTEWAQADALRLLSTPQAEMTIGSRLASFAILTRQLKHSAGETGELAPILAWLHRLALAQRDYWSYEAPKAAQRGNLRAWANLALWVIGDLTGDAEMKRWASDSSDAILCSAGPDGSLPIEMRRGEFALHYHLHAVAPLVTLQALRTRPGKCAEAIKRVAEFVLSDIAHGERSEKLSGVTQSYFNGTESLSPHELAWVEAYLTLEHSEMALAIAKDLRPLHNSKLGGNQTKLWRH
jgi:poly(beta-D-mannuronate) lyase